jgi:MoaA/NifB/PqqE/SkfB family radical SAM enzyme
MNSLELYQKLQAKYDIICFYDLATLTESPGDIFNLFYKLYKPAYNANERLVFYTNQTPSDLLIQHIYRASNIIDISNFFVMIVAPNIEPVLTKNLVHSTDKICFDFLDLEIQDASILHNNFVIPDTICPMPWMHLEVGLNGEIRPCCVYEGSLSTIDKSSLLDSFNSKDIQEIRQMFLQGKKTDQCTRCWSAESKGMTSHRQKHLQMLGRDFLGKYLNQPTVVSLDLKPSNLCNFKCRICNPSASSLYAYEASKNQNIIVKDHTSRTDLIFNKELPLLIDTLQNIDFYGGEPFYIKQIISFVEECVQSQHCSHLRLHFNTNGSVYPDKLEKHWQHFNHVDIQFSIDDIGKRFNLERGADWKVVESNIKRFLDLNLHNMTFGIMPVISIMNVFYLDELFDWANQLGLQIYSVLLEEPKEMCIENISFETQEQLLKKYQNSSHEELQKLHRVIKNIKIDPTAPQKFIDKMQYFDSVRNESFATSHREIAKLMGMC